MITRNREKLATLSVATRGKNRLLNRPKRKSLNGIYHRIHYSRFIPFIPQSPFNPAIIMRLDQVVKGLLTYTKVIVTGPQRAGTTIATKILADVLELSCQLEEVFDTVDVFRFFRFIDQVDFFVLQAPSMAAYCHYLPENFAVVFMQRNLEDILNSQERIGWTENYTELECQRYFRTTETPPAVLKYNYWEKLQRPFLGQRGFDLDYESLRQHSFWIDKKDRAQFHSRQTE